MKPVVPPLKTSDLRNSRSEIFDMKKAQKVPALGARQFSTSTLPRMNQSSEEKQMERFYSQKTLPKVVEQKKGHFKANREMWASQTTSNFSRQNLRTPTFNLGIHERNFGFFSIRAPSQVGKAQQAKNSCFDMEAHCTRGFNPKNSQLFTQTDERDLQTHEKEAKKIKREKMRWKHAQDEELREQLYTNLRSKLAQPLPLPELYDETTAQEERAAVERATLRSQKGQRMRLKLQQAHEQKYGQVWAGSHAAKLSSLRKYDLSEARLRPLASSPQNLLIFNGKMLQWLQGNHLSLAHSKLSLGV